MRKFLAILLVTLLAACAGSTKTAPAPTTPAAHKDITPQQMQEAMAKASSIGPNHHKLNPLVGHYKVEAKFWMKPGTPPEVTTGTADFAWVLDGHYLAMNYVSSFQGQPYRGEGMFGYNNIAGQYQSTWADTMGTEIMMASGNFDKDGGLVFNGEFKCPVTDNAMKTREVLRIGTDQHVYEMYHPALDGSGEFKAMEITYERLKPTAKVSLKKTKL